MRLLKRETKFILLTEENLGTDNCDQEEYYGQTYSIFDISITEELLRGIVPIFYSKPENKVKKLP